MTDKAILFGINDYESIADLRGCENDVDNIRRLLVEGFRFSENQIHVFRNEEVVRKTVEQEFEWLAKDSRPGDRLVFHFSGHGSYTASESDDKTVDELICLYDMDWDNPSSFIRDTDLGRLTRTVDSGARLTVILDSCHSGTGTRAITANLRQARAVSPRTRLMIVEDTARQLAKVEGDAIDHRARLMRTEAATMRLLRRDASHPVYARFVEPPAAIQKLRSARRAVKVRKLGEALRAELNHQLLAAAEEAQTAADAFIGDDYHGAFTYYFTEASRQSLGHGTFASVMEQTRSELVREGYSQNPQLDGPFAAELLFGGPAQAPPTDAGSVGIPTLAEPERESELLDEVALVDPADTAAGPLAILDRLLRVSEKLVDLSSTAAHRADVPTVRAARATDNEVIVYVHGISMHLPDYSLPWYNALAPHVSRPIPRREVRWSQHVNSRDLPRETREVDELRRLIEAELDRRIERIEQHAQRVAGPTGTARAAVRVVRQRDLSIDDFTRYMLVAATREAILGEFQTIVFPLLQAGRTLHIISHSWGTVVAYEGLRRLDSQGLPGHVANLFVVGSALSIGAVRTNLFGRVTDGRMPAHVRRVVNLDAGGDIIGGAIGDHFIVDREYLGLDPVGCSKIPFTGIAWNPACAHSSYFRSTNRTVNRDIFARHIGSALP